MSRITLFELTVLTALIGLVVAVCAVNQLATGTTIIASVTMIGAYLLARTVKGDMTKDKHIGFH